MLVCVHGTVTAKNAMCFLILIIIIVNQNGYYKSLKNRTLHYCYEVENGATSKIIHASQQEWLVCTDCAKPIFVISASILALSPSITTEGQPKDS